MSWTIENRRQELNPRGPAKRMEDPTPPSIVASLLRWLKEKQTKNDDLLDLAEMGLGTPFVQIAIRPMAPV